VTISRHAEHHLLDHLLAFGRLLRQFGVTINPGQMLDLLAALEYVEIGRREDVYLTCRAILVQRREDLPVFDEAWQFFWASQRQGNPGGVALPDNRVQELPVPRRLQRERPDRARDDQTHEQQQEIEVQMSYSRSEQLRQKDFAQFTGDEIDQARALIAQLAYRVAERPVRRWTSGKGHRIDARRTLRHTLRTGGETLTLWHKTRRLKQRPLVVLCDISGSMDRYSRILLQFVHTISAGLRDVETFVFGTRLTRITRMLQHKDIDEAVLAVGGAVQDWSGGTRIGDAIKAFNFRWGRRVLGRGAIVLLISDGWDRGDPELLGREIARLQRTSYRLIWLNPLLGMPGYQPLTRGLQAALPHVDDFLPVHNLHSLEQLGAKLAETLRR
jgi:uncharacterized protein